ncbi:DUF6479 family protein [Streptomyces sp. NPDC059909]|uniref:DUF6479 family protein n=1 Tax=Streptomyces sp. NPDC059909 TaxID=3346998 RepID=UPI003653CF7F
MNPLMIAQGSPATTEVVAASPWAGLVPFLIAVVLVVVLGGAMWLEARRRAQERAPRPEEQPKVPDHPTHIEEIREPDEADFPTDGARLLPYNLKTHSTHGVPMEPAGPGEGAAAPGAAAPGEAATPGEAAAPGAGATEPAAEQQGGRSDAGPAGSAGSSGSGGSAQPS